MLRSDGARVDRPRRQQGLGATRTTCKGRQLSSPHRLESCGRTFSTGQAKKDQRRISGRSALPSCLWNVRVCNSPSTLALGGAKLPPSNPLARAGRVKGGECIGGEAGIELLGINHVNKACINYLLSDASLKYVFYPRIE